MKSHRALSKKAFYVLLSVLTAVAVIASVFIIVSLNRKGAETPENAVWQYERAAMLYDAENMVEYSSPYNIAVLNRANPTDGELYDYLKRVYSGKKSVYSADKLSCTVLKSEKCGSGDARYSALLEDYRSLVPDGEAQEFCFVTLAISHDGVKKLEYPAVAVRSGKRWFFFRPNV